MIMPIKKILRLLGSKSNSTSNEVTDSQILAYNVLLSDFIKEASEVSPYKNFWYSGNLGNIHAYQKIKVLSVEGKKQLVEFLIKEIIRITKKIRKERNRGYNNKDENFKRDGYTEVLGNLMRSKLNYQPDEIISIFDMYKEADDTQIRMFKEWPIGYSIQQLERLIKKEGYALEIKNFIGDILAWPQLNRPKNYSGADLDKVKAKLNKLLYESDNTKSGVPPYILPEDRFALIVNAEVAMMKESQQNAFYALFHLFVKVTTSKPSVKYLKETGVLIDEIGIVNYKAVVYSWINFICNLKEIETVNSYEYNNSSYRYSTYEFLHEKNHVFLKGLVWSCTKLYDSNTLALIARLAERCFKKIPGVGPAAASVGNACLYVLGHTRGLEGISHLSRLKFIIKQNNTKKLIERYLHEASAKMGISSSEIEELSVPDFGLINGKKEIAFDEYKAQVDIGDFGKVHLRWIKPDGSLQKSVPSFVKDSVRHLANLKKVKADVLQIKKYLTAQRDRIDRMYLDNREWQFDKFQKHYIEHGLVGFIGKRLLWQFSKDNSYTSGRYEDGKWKDINGNLLEWIDENTKVRLWHPVFEDTESVLRWRNAFEEIVLKQPMKQVYREVYILTDAEVNTKTYSNRMAAHIIKQHQFNALTAVRGWKYTIMGAFDNRVDSGLATVPVQSLGLEAQFWINEILADDQFTDSGIWNYVATDQVRFVKDGEPVDLIEVPQLIFSEVMRDVDLFVGVCSVGNDPEWQDNGGLPQYRDYWTSYSFGDLTEIAKTRKELLEKIVPKLKIRNVATIEGKFLKVRGTKRVYKIHIGSTNILMEPNDQYLCIVPDRSAKNGSKDVFLPFEGDRGLSLVLSKAFLLAEDEKITDTTILSQINQK